MITLYLVTHNYSRFLTDALASISGQVKSPSQIILIDNGSDDAPERFFEAWRAKEGITVMYNANIGHISAANQALALASGDCMIRLDGDDVLLPNALQWLKLALDMHPNAVCACGDYFLVDEAGNQLAEVEATTRLVVANNQNRLHQSIGSATPQMDLLMLGSTVAPPHGAVTLIRTSVLRRIGGYDESITRGDGDFLARKLHGQPFVHVRQPLFLYRQHGANLSQNPDFGSSRHF